MKTLQFSIKINTSKQKVWQTLWEDKTFRDWSNIIDEGTYIKGKLIEGQTIQFLSASGYGVTSLVAKLIPNQHITFKHMVDTKDSGNEKRENEWTGGTETYELQEINGTTTLTITTEVPDEMVEMFQERLPKALARIKELAENISDDEILEFGEKNPDAQYRKSVGAVIYNPSTQKILTLNWKIYPVYGIVQGGQDDGESETEALQREIVEETGYTNFEIQEKLGSNIISYFFADNKNVWRKLELACYLVKLNGAEQIEQKLEGNENFEIKWLKIQDYIDMLKSHIPSKSQNFQGILEFVQRAKKYYLINKSNLYHPRKTD